MVVMQNQPNAKGECKMKALIVSDNHKDEYRMQELIDIYENEIDLLATLW